MTVPIVPLLIACALALPATLIALDATRDIPILDRLARRPVVRIALGLMAVPLLMLVLLFAIALLPPH